MDKRPKDMTPDELKALPEYSSFEYVDKTDPKTGHTTRQRLPMKMYAAGVNPDDIAFWSDENGTWSPEYMGPDAGWAKRQIFI